MGILTDIENLFEPAEAEVKSFVETVATDVTAWAKAEETFLKAEADIAWAAIKPILTGIGPAEWSILQGLIQTAAKDAAEGDYTGIATDVIAQATTAETAFIIKLGQQVVGVYAAVMAYKPAT